MRVGKQDFHRLQSIAVDKAVQFLFLLFRIESRVDYDGFESTVPDDAAALLEAVEI